MQLNTKIFQQIPKTERDMLLCELRAESLPYEKGACLLMQGEKNEYISVLISGSAHAVRYAREGREEDYTLLEEGDLFGDALAMSFEHESFVSIYADTPCTVLRFRYFALLNCKHPYANMLQQSLTQELAEKFFRMQKRMYYLTKPTLRGKLLAYLYDCKQEAGSDTFQIPLNRNELASYLYCDRSALCRELSKLKREGILSVCRERFCFLV